MNKRAKLVVLGATLITIALILLPQIIEAKRSIASKTNTATSLSGSLVPVQTKTGKRTVGSSIRNDTSPPLREMKQKPMDFKPEREANENPKVPHIHKDSDDPVVQRTNALSAFVTP